MLNLSKSVCYSIALSGALLTTACGSDSDSKSSDPAKNTETGFDLRLLHMNDHHSHLASEALKINVESQDWAQQLGVESVKVNMGGFPMLKTAMDQLSTERSHVLKLHSGDAITGTPFYSLYEGEADAAMMNEICFDAFALGNHEFDDGDAGLAKFLDYLNAGSCGTPTLAANVVPHAESAIASDYIQPYTILERGGEKIGVIGIDIANKTKLSSSPDEGTTFLEEVATSQKYIDELTEQGINKIVLMTHYTYENDLVLAESLSGVDVIVGGDSHTLLGRASLSHLGFNPKGEYPTIKTDLAGNKVCVVQAWEYAHIVGALDVSFDHNGEVQKCEGNPYFPFDAAKISYKLNDETVELNANEAFVVEEYLASHSEFIPVSRDDTTSAVLASFQDEIEALKTTVIGTISSDLCLERFPGQGKSGVCDVSATAQHGSDISNIVAKAFLEVTATADIAIQNGGGVRVDVVQGDYTYADAYTLLPFSNTLVTLTLTGQQIKQVLEDAIDFGLDSKDGSTGAYPYASGLRFNVDASLVNGSRVSEIEVNQRLAGDWAPIELDAIYTVVTNDYIAKGKDGYLTFGEVFGSGNYVNTYKEYAQGFIDFLEMQNGQPLSKLPIDEYSTKQYIDVNGCNLTSDICNEDTRID